MTAAMEWTSKRLGCSNWSHMDESLALIKEIQLDAFKAGMEHAAKLYGEDAILLKQPENWGFLMNKKQEIIDTAQQLTQLP
jgi:hypothetical protein